MIRPRGITSPSFLRPSTGSGAGTQSPPPRRRGASDARWPWAPACAGVTIECSTCSESALEPEARHGAAAPVRAAIGKAVITVDLQLPPLGKLLCQIGGDVTLRAGDGRRCLARMEDPAESRALAELHGGARLAQEDGLELRARRAADDFVAEPGGNGEPPS